MKANTKASHDTVESERSLAPLQATSALPGWVHVLDSALNVGVHDPSALALAFTGGPEHLPITLALMEAARDRLDSQVADVWRACVKHRHRTAERFEYLTEWAIKGDQIHAQGDAPGCHCCPADVAYATFPVAWLYLTRETLDATLQRS